MSQDPSTPSKTPPGSPAPGAPSQAHPPSSTPPTGNPVAGGPQALGKSGPNPLPAGPVMSGSQPAISGPGGIDGPRLSALLAEAMNLSGIGQKAELAAMFLRGSMSRILHPDAIDFGVIWHGFVDEMYLGKEQTARALLLSAIYIAETYKAQIRVPAEAQGLMASQNLTEQDSQAMAQRLAQAVEERLQRQQEEQARAAAAVQAAGEKAKAERAKGQKAKAEQKQDADAELIRVGRGKKKQKKTFEIGNNPLIGVLSGMVLLAIIGFWVNELVIKEMAKQKKRDAFYSKKTVDVSEFPKELALNSADLTAGTLRVHLSDDKLAQLPIASQESVGDGLLQAQERLGAMRMVVFSDQKHYSITKDGTGLVHVKIRD